MKQVTWTITENTPLTPDTYRLRLAGDTEAITAPGQFVNPVSYTHLTLPTILLV